DVSADYVARPLFPVRSSGASSLGAVGVAQYAHGLRQGLGRVGSQRCQHGAAKDVGAGAAGLAGDLDTSFGQACVDHPSVVGAGDPAHEIGFAQTVGDLGETAAGKRCLTGETGHGHAVFG